MNSGDYYVAGALIHAIELWEKYPDKIQYGIINKYEIFNQFSKITGCRCIPDYNHNFDIVYNLLTTLQQNGLIDYYISKDLSCIFLLFQ